MMRTVLAICTFLFVLTGCAGINFPGMAPDVMKASRGEMQFLACGENAETCGDIVAVYDHKARVMYLPEDWSDDPKTWTDYRQSVLIHEYVHHVQAIRGDFQRKCSGDLEREAYQAQIAFLRARGHENPFAVMNLGPITYMSVTACGM